MFRLKIVTTYGIGVACGFRLAYDFEQIGVVTPYPRRRFRSVGIEGALVGRQEWTLWRLSEPRERTMGGRLRTMP
jgi:hypothetical protein